MKKNKKKFIVLRKNEKIPQHKNYYKNKYKKSEIKEYKDRNHNIGLIIGTRLVVLDIDIRNGGLESYNNLEKNVLKTKLPFNVKTPGGYHIYFKLTKNQRNQIKNNKVIVKKDIEKYKGIDIKYGDKSYVVYPSSEINGIKYEIICDNVKKCPDEVFKLITNDNNIYYIENNNSSYFKPKEKVVLNYLSKLDPSIEYKIWICIGMSLHSWDSKKGFEIWDRWSSRSDKYKEGECLKKWNSFNKDKSINIGYLFKLVYDTNIDYKSLKHFIKNEDKLDIKFENLNSNNKSLLDTLKKEKEKIIDLLSDNRKIKKNVSQKIVNEKIDNLNKFVKLDFVNDLFHIEDKKYYNIKTQKILTSNHIDQKYTHEIINISKSKASNYLVKIKLPEIEGFQFKPNINKTYFKDRKGRFIANKFILGSFPSFNENKPKTEGYEAAIDRILTHLNILCNGNKTYANVLKNWIAYQRQYKGILLRWAPVIIGIQGIGKSYLEDLMCVLLGEDNVEPLNPLEYRSTFNEWADSNSLLIVFNEFLIDGKDANKIMDIIKPSITDRKISITKKHSSKYKIYNHTNYLYLTNNENCMPITEDDRRFWILKNEMKSLNEIETKYGYDKDKYYEDLFGDLKKYQNEFIEYFSTLPIDESFLKRKRPDSIYNDSMSSIQFNAIEGYEIAKQILEEDHKYYNKNYFLKKPFIDEVQRILNITLSNHKQDKLVKALRFYCVPDAKNIKIKNNNPPFFTGVYTSDLSKYTLKYILELIKQRELEGG